MSKIKKMMKDKKEKRGRLKIRQRASNEEVVVLNHCGIVIIIRNYC